MRELPSMPQRDIIEHRAIVDAIAAGAPQRAREAMVTHIRSFSKSVSALTCAHEPRTAVGRGK
jgi:DNA-binding FadR family transcriptional regulator